MHPYTEEMHYQQQMEGWRMQLDEKHRQFEEARAQIMQPKELEKLRRQLMDELEAPTREKLQAFEREADLAHDKFLVCQRELEVRRCRLTSG